MKGAIILLYREILFEDGVHFVSITYPLKPQSVLLRKKIPQSRYGGHLELCKKYIYYGMVRRGWGENARILACCGDKLGFKHFKLVWFFYPLFRVMIHRQTKYKSKSGFQKYFILDQILFPSRQTSIVPLIFVKQCSIHIPQWADDRKTGL